MVKEIVAILLAGNMLFGSSYVKESRLSDATVKVTEDMIADYSSIEFYGINGSVLTVSVSGQSLVFKSDKAKNYRVNFNNVNTLTIMSSISYKKSSFEFDVSDHIKKNGFYCMDLRYELDGVSYRQQDIFFCVDSSKKLHFAKSPTYDFNVERITELQDDEQSLKECLMPQNDIESDNAEIISLSEDLTLGSKDKWQEVTSIYEYITDEYYYDNVQINGTSVYQDNALTLTRRKIAICEGYANVFVALCRARGIPAVVEYGIGKDAYTFFTDEEVSQSEVSNHAWAAVYIDGRWYFLDPTFDNNNSFDGHSISEGELIYKKPSHDFFLMSLETFSMCHKICDADTVHCIEKEGSCGTDASFKLTRDGTLTIYGSGELVLPKGLNGFSKIIFDENSDITVIGENCFRDCDLVESVILPESVTRIEDSAFRTCEDLKYVYIPEGVTYIGRQAFDFCDELAYIYIPDSILRIDSFAFDDCPRLYISVPKKCAESFEGYENKPVHVEVR